MIPASFDYVRATSVAEAVEALTAGGEDAKLLAGGHSLLPLMKLRLATPSVLVDVGRVEELVGVRDDGDVLAIGALTTHRMLQRSPLVAEEVPLLAATAGHVGDPQVRNRGTLGGSLAHGDGAADLPAAILALDGELVARGPAGERRIPAREFFTGFLETALAPDEVLCEVRVPKVPGVGWSFQKFAHRARDWAIVGCAVLTGTRPGFGLVNMASRPLRAEAAEDAFRAGAPIAEVAALADRDTDPPVDHHGPEEYRRHLARVLLRRGLDEAAARDGRNGRR